MLHLSNLRTKRKAKYQIMLPSLWLAIAQTCSHEDHCFCRIHQNSHLQWKINMQIVIFLEEASLTPSALPQDLPL